MIWINGAWHKPLNPTKSVKTTTRCAVYTPDWPGHAEDQPGRSWQRWRTGRGPTGRCPPGGWCERWRCLLHGRCSDRNTEYQISLLVHIMIHTHKKTTTTPPSWKKTELNKELVWRDMNRLSRQPCWTCVQCTCGWWGTASSARWTGSRCSPACWWSCGTSPGWSRWRRCCCLRGTGCGRSWRRCTAAWRSSPWSPRRQTGDRTQCTDTQGERLSSFPPITCCLVHHRWEELTVLSKIFQVSVLECFYFWWIFFCTHISELSAS